MPKGDKEILKADPEDGTTPVANLLLEAMAIAKLSGKEKGIILYLWRRIYGWVKDGKRLKERAIPLTEFGKVCNSDNATASKLLSGLVKKNILKREFAGPGKGYTYSMNTRVVEWDKGCINHQLLKELTIQRLVKNTTQPLLKNTTPSDTESATPKESIKETIKQEGVMDEIIITKESVLEVYKKEIAGLHEEESLNEAVERDIEDAIGKFTAPWVIDAIREGVKRKIKNWPYIATILKNRKRYAEDAKNKGGVDPDKYIKGKYGHLVNR